MRGILGLLGAFVAGWAGWWLGFELSGSPPRAQVALMVRRASA